MAKFLQFNGNSPIPMLVESATAPIHPNQYLVDDATDFVAIRDLAYDATTGALYPAKLVPDTSLSGIPITLGNKVSG